MTASQIDFAAKGFEDGKVAYAACVADFDGEEPGEYNPNSDWDSESWHWTTKALDFDPTPEQQAAYFEGYKNGWNSCR